MIYAKLNNGALEYAPKNITLAGVTYKPATEAALKAAGFKPVKYADYPQDGNEYAEQWRETSKQISQSWQLVREISAEERRELAYQNELICEWRGELKTCDEMEKLFYQYFAEEGKETLCAEIKAVITAGKAHIREEYPEEV